MRLPVIPLPTAHDLDHDVVLAEASVCYPRSSRARTLREDAFSPRRAARIAGAAFLITNATAIFSEFLVRSRLIVDGDAASTASNIVAHAQLFRVAIVCDLLTCAGVVILNLALYELLAPVHRSLARLASFWRLTESAVYGAITVSNFVVLSVLTTADYLQAFDARQVQALASLFVGARTSGFWIAMLFLLLGSTIYCYLLVRSRYVPKALALFGVIGSALGVLSVIVRILFPAFVAATFAAVQGLPAVALALLAVIVVPIFSFEFTLGLWLLVKGVHIPEHT